MSKSLAEKIEQALRGHDPCAAFHAAFHGDPLHCAECGEPWYVHLLREAADLLKAGERAHLSASPLGWVVVIGRGVWAKCYGPFKSHDETMAWVRANQFEVQDASAHPVNLPEQL